MSKFVGTQWGSAKTTAELENGFCLSEDHLRLTALCNYSKFRPDELKSYFSAIDKPEFSDFSPYGNSSAALLLEILLHERMTSVRKDSVASLRKKFWENALSKAATDIDSETLRLFNQNVADHYWYEFKDGSYVDVSVDQLVVTEDSLVVLFDMDGRYVDDIELASFAIVIDNYVKEKACFDVYSLFDKLWINNCFHVLLNAQAIVDASENKLQIHSMPYVKVIEGGPNLASKIVVSEEFVNYIDASALNMIVGERMTDICTMTLARLYDEFKKNKIKLPKDFETFGKELGNINTTKPVPEDIVEKIAKIIGCVVPDVGRLPRYYCDDRGVFVAESKGGVINIYDETELPAPTRDSFNQKRMRNLSHAAKVLLYVFDTYVQSLYETQYDVVDLVNENFPDPGTISIDALYALLYEFILNHENNVIDVKCKEYTDYVIITYHGKRRFVPLNLYNTIFNLNGRVFVDAVSSLPYTIESGAATKGGLGGGFLEILQNCVDSEVMLNYSPRVAAQTEGKKSEVDVLKTTDLSGYLDGHIYMRNSDSLEYISGRDWAVTSRKGVNRFTLYALCLQNKGRPDAFAIGSLMLNGSVCCYNDGSSWSDYLQALYGISVDSRVSPFDDANIINVCHNDEWTCLTMVDPNIDLVNRKASNKPVVREDKKTFSDVVDERTSGLNEKEFFGGYDGRR